MSRIFRTAFRWRGREGRHLIPACSLLSTTASRQDKTVSAELTDITKHIDTFAVEMKIFYCNAGGAQNNQRTPNTSGPSGY
jgi:hypothetical protein